MSEQIKRLAREVASNPGDRAALDALAAALVRAGHGPVIRGVDGWAIRRDGLAPPVAPVAQIETTALGLEVVAERRAIEVAPWWRGGTGPYESRWGPVPHIYAQRRHAAAQAGRLQRASARHYQHGERAAEPTARCVRVRLVVVDDPLERWREG